MLIEALYVLLFIGTSPNCESKGICKMEIEYKDSKIVDVNCVEAVIGKYESGVALAITEADIKDETFLKYFTGNYFEVPYDYTLPKEITDKINVKEGFVIKKGKYAYKQSDTQIVIIIK